MAGPLRSWLFAPAHRARLVEKVGEVGADAIILDLEDAVPLAEKASARQAAAAGVARWAGRQVYVRINPLRASTPYTLAEGRADLEAVLVPGLCGVLLPKAEDPADLRELDDLLAEGEARLGLAPRSLDLVPLIETARGLWNLLDLLQAAPRVRRVAFGAYDFARDLDIRLSPEGHELLLARSRLVLASRVAGREAPIDTVYAQIDDDAGLERQAALARGLGFQGKLVIHPRQVPTVNAAFSPTAEEIAQARRVVAAFDQAEASGSAAIALDGMLVDYPVAQRARELLARARAIAEREPGGDEAPTP